MFLIITPKQVYATRRLKQEAGETAEFFDVHELAEQNFNIDISKYSSLYIRQAWPYFKEVINLAKKFQQAGKRVVDTNMANGDVDVSKWVMHHHLELEGLSVPKTFLFSDVIPVKTGIQSQDPRIKSEDDMSFPLIAKWIYGFAAKQVYFVRNEEELEKVRKKYPAHELLLQEFIQAKYEYKVITVGYKSLPVVLRFDTEQKTFKSDLSSYDVIPVKTGILSNNEKIPHQVRDDIVREVISLAEKSARCLGRELAKIDVLEDFSGNLFVLEVNRYPGFENFEKLTGLNVAKEFLNYFK